MGSVKKVPTGWRARWRTPRVAAVADVLAKVDAGTAYLVSVSNSKLRSECRPPCRTVSRSEYANKPGEF